MSVRTARMLGAPASAALVVLMAAGCLALWIAVPVAWLWIGSQIQSSVSLATALGVTMTGIIATILLVASGLSWLNRRHLALQQARDQPIAAHGVLEPLLVASAAIALVVFAFWFFGLAGATPIPLNISY
ncbi:MAG: hypothetical protein ACR2N5_03975 [Solirubrobacterales bacterium]